MEELNFSAVSESGNYISHLGKAHDDNPPGRGSGRYAWGEGERMHQHDWDIYNRYRKRKSLGMTDAEIARAMGVEGVDDMTVEQYRKAACDAVKQLSMDVGIPADLKAIAKEEDVQFLSESAYADACRPGNPKDTSVEDIAALYRSLM